jgi:UDP-N-acetylmuramoyl-L-alanyl-D-glutamate--2,6-diaminopimelate ligase
MLNRFKKRIGYNNPWRRLWHWLKGFIALCIYRFPGNKMICIGITGTNGKTTTTHIVEHILTSAGKKVGMASTINFAINGKMEPNTSKKTTASPFLIQKLLRQCVQKNVQYMIIETSSHALHQFRVLGIAYQIAALTNITHEHLDYHGTMEEYKNAKKKLFKKTPHLVLNTADEYFAEFKAIPSATKITYGIGRGSLQALNPMYSKFGSHFTLKNGDDSIKVAFQIPGAFNIENALAATGVALSCGLSLSEIKSGLESFSGVPGRMERIKSPRGFEVIVDFGLTADALEKIYTEIRKTAPARIIGIIGSCGDRDKTKRPDLGRIVATHTNVTIVTDEEPYSEDPMLIMQAVLSGAEEVKTKNVDLFLIEDRTVAIEYAVAHAEPDDIIVITGMGNFQTRTMNSGPMKWDEREVVREVIASDASCK